MSWEMLVGKVVSTTTAKMSYACVMTSTKYLGHCIDVILLLLYLLLPLGIVNVQRTKKEHETG